MTQASSELTATVRVERILYPHPFISGEFAIISCSINRVEAGEPYDHNRITLKGKMYSADIGMLYTFTGTLVENERYGQGYNIRTFNMSNSLYEPSEQNNYLSIVLTNRQNDLLHAQFSNPYQVLMDKDMNALSAVKGIGKKEAEKIIKKFHDRIDQAKAFSVLSNYGMTLSSISSLLRRYPSVDHLLDMMERNPYLLIDEVSGVGWARADAIAMAKGIHPLDPMRIDAYITHFLDIRANDGHTWCSPQTLWDAVSYDIGTNDQDVLRQALDRMQENGRLWCSPDHTQIALSRLRRLEEKIALELHRIASAEPLQPSVDALNAIHAIEYEQGWEFTEEQMSAIHGILDSNVSIVTGGAGVGKTSVVSGVLKLLSNYPFVQCALSGRAAARMTEVTHEEGKTIHRLLGYSNGAFTFNKENPLSERIIILDEISMVGADIFYKLISAIQTGAKLIMLGDDGQLPSIGLCNIFKDMLDSGVVSVNRLTKIHRQSAKSAIITESMKVRNQQALCPTDWVGTDVRGELHDLKLEVYGDPILTRPNIINEYKQLIAEGVSYHNIQIVVPMKTRGDACTRVINDEIQSYINQKNLNKGINIKRGKNEHSLLCVDDRVICTKNMYRASHPGEESDCPVYNGDRGVIKEINERKMIVTFDLWGDILFKRDQFCNIELGYALSCHKLQGSEADHIIIGFDMNSRILLTKEWLYTAITRAKKYCVLLAEKRALNYCIATSDVPLKQTFLCSILRDEFARPYVPASNSQISNDEGDEEFDCGQTDPCDC